MADPAIPVIVASGEYRDIGRQVGEAARRLIQSDVEACQARAGCLGPLPMDEAEQRVRPYLRFARRHLPQYVEQLGGLAEASNVPFIRLFAMSCSEELTCPTHSGPSGDGVVPATRACTGLAIMSDRARIVAHNEDWYPLNDDSNVVLDLTFPDSTRLLSLTYASGLPMTGINSHGLAASANTLYSNDNREGVPNSFLLAWLLQSRNLEEARERVCAIPRARGSNHLLADDKGRIWDIETSASDVDLVEGSTWYVHTNHYVSPRMTRYEGSEWAESPIRFQRASELVAAGLESGKSTLSLVKGVLSDHANAPSSICVHPDEASPPSERFQTVASMVWDLGEMKAHVCSGNPCCSPRWTLSL
jgi:isopenicillin-N N-acyltransferase-like protein